MRSLRRYLLLYSPYILCVPPLRPKAVNGAIFRISIYAVPATLLERLEGVCEISLNCPD